MERKKQKPLEEIAEDLEEEVSVIEPIYRAAEKFAPEYDPKLVFEQVNADNKQEKLADRKDLQKTSKNKSTGK